MPPPTLCRIHLYLPAHPTLSFFLKIKTNKQKIPSQFVSQCPWVGPALEYGRPSGKLTLPLLATIMADSPLARPGTLYQRKDFV